VILVGADQLLAGVGITLYFLGFAYYGKCMLTGKVNPSLASWGQWAFLGILLATSAYFMNHGDFVKSLQAYGTSAANVTMLTIVLVVHKYDKLRVRDVQLGLFGLAAILIWWLTHSATYAQLVLLIPIIISIIPTWLNTWEEPRREDPVPWVVISCSYLLTGAATGLRIRHWSVEWPQVALHVTGFAAQIVVALIAILKKNR
jgi:hypothetical protein